MKRKSQFARRCALVSKRMPPTGSICTVRMPIRRLLAAGSYSSRFSPNARFARIWQPGSCTGPASLRCPNRSVIKNAACSSADSPSTCATSAATYGDLSTRASSSSVCRCGGSAPAANLTAPIRSCVSYDCRRFWISGGVMDNSLTILYALRSELERSAFHI